MQRPRTARAGKISLWANHTHTDRRSLQSSSSCHIVPVWKEIVHVAAQQQGITLDQHHERLLYSVQTQNAQVGSGFMCRKWYLSLRDTLLANMKSAIILESSQSQDYISGSECYDDVPERIL